jgi:hypothetical protein
MKLEISSFADPGNLQKERLVMKALSDIDIGNYAVFISNVSDDGKATAGPKTAFWFPDGTVRAGDLVVLYTKAGQDSKKDLADGTTVHFYYWGITDVLWGRGDKTAVILRVAEWTNRTAQVSKP